MAGKLTDVELARLALEQLPENADSHTILAAVDQRLKLERDVNIANEVVAARKETAAVTGSGWVSDAFGCLAPLLGTALFFIAMPILFSVGDWIFSPPARGTASGKIADLVLVNGTDTKALQGRPCRVIIDHLLIELENGQTTMIPNAAVVQLVLDK